MLRLAREGIPPSEYGQLDMAQWATLRGILSGESEGFKIKRGQFG